MSRQINDYLNFFVQDVTIPEVRAQTIAVNGHENMGIVREQTINIIYGKPLTMTVIEDSDFSVYKSLRQWFDRQAQNANQGGGLVAGRSLRMNYYDDFTFDIEIQKLEQPDNVSNIRGSQEPNANYKNPITVKFINAYPVSMGSIQMSSTAIDQATSFTISFSYESYSVTDSEGTIGQLMRGFFG